MADVVNLKTRSVIVNEGIVDVLERWLVEAKEGTLTGLAACAVSNDTFRYAIPPTEDTAMLLTAMTCATQRLIRNIEDE